VTHPDGGEDPETMDLGELLPFLGRRLRSQRTQELEPYGLTFAQNRAFGTVARALDAGTELRPSDLAERLGIAPRSATEVVDALQDKSLVQRTPSPNDRRATLLSLTEEGIALRQRMRRELARARRAKADDLFSVLSEKDRDTLTDLLRKVARTVD